MFSSTAPVGTRPPRESDPEGQISEITDSFRSWNEGTCKDDPATTSMSIQKSAPSPSTEYPWTATPYSPSSGSVTEIVSEEVPLHDLVTSSPEEKMPSPSSSLKRNRSRSTLS